MRRPSPRPLSSACALLLAVAGLLVLAPVRAARADDIDARQKQVAAALQAATADLDDADAATVQAAQQLQAVQAQLTDAQATLDADRAQLAAAQTVERQAAAAAAFAQESLDRATDARDAAAARVQDKQQTIREYAVAAYEGASLPDPIQILATSSDGNDYVQRANLVDLAARGESAQLTTYRSEQVALQAAQEKVADDTRAVIDKQQAAQAAVDKVAAVTASAQQQTSRLASLASQRSAVLANAESALAAQRARVAQLQAESVQITALLQARASRGNVTIGKGGLLWPAAGPKTSDFGYRTDPVTHKYQLHAGIDIGAPEGADIHAAKAGTVVFAGQETGYGNYTCIDHGGGFSTCYAHQSAIDVRVGQVVTQGQVIGQVGATGYATGPHLHFETRENGNPVDPMQFF